MEYISADEVFRALDKCAHCVEGIGDFSAKHDSAHCDVCRLREKAKKLILDEKPATEEEGGEDPLVFDSAFWPKPGVRMVSANTTEAARRAIERFVGCSDERLRGGMSADQRLAYEGLLSALAAMRAPRKGAKP